MSDFKTENIVGELNLLLLNIPDNLSLIEKIRWLYIKVGKLFSYDYRIANDSNVAYKEIDFYKNYVSKYQTCLQISYLFNMMLNYIDPNIKARVIERKMDIRGRYEVEHQANEVILPSGEKYILDLTLDLFLIQSGCQTKHFCFESDASGEYDIIPLCDIKDIDNKLGLDTNYTDYKIKEVKEKMSSIDYSNMSILEMIDSKIMYVNTLMKEFSGYHEGKQYVDKLLHDVLEMQYKEFNLTYKHNDTMDLITCYCIKCNEEERWIIYNNKLGLVFTSLENIKNMLNNGWETKSETLDNIIHSRKYLI